MLFSPKGIKLTSNEVVDFFQNHCEMATIVLHDSDGNVTGEITAITAENQFVLDLDVAIPASCDVFSRRFNIINVTAPEDGVFIVTIIN